MTLDDPEPQPGMRAASWPATHQPSTVKASSQALTSVALVYLPHWTTCIIQTNHILRCSPLPALERPLGHHPTSSTALHLPSGLPGKSNLFSFPVSLSKSHLNHQLCGFPLLPLSFALYFSESPLLPSLTLHKNVHTYASPSRLWTPMTWTRSSNSVCLGVYLCVGEKSRTIVLLPRLHIRILLSLLKHTHGHAPYQTHEIRHLRRLNLASV